MRQDIRTAADVQDFQTSFQKPPIAGLDVRISADDTNKLVRVTVDDWPRPGGRSENVSYSLYYFPFADGNLTSLIGSKFTAAAAAKAARLLLSQNAPGNQDSVVFEYPPYYKRKGYYFVTGKNREGKESSASPAVPSPWNI